MSGCAHMSPDDYCASCVPTKLVALREENARLRQRVEELERRLTRETELLVECIKTRTELGEMVVDCLAEHPPEAEYTAWCEAGKPDIAAMRAQSRLREIDCASETLRAEAAEAKLAKVVEMHHMTEIGEGYSYQTSKVCAECGQDWPCPTLAAAKGE